MITEHVKIIDDLDESYGSSYGLSFKDSIFVFETVKERNSWLQDCTVDDLEFIINQEENIES